MGYLYICTLIFLGITFIALKKSDKELNLIKWICIFIAGSFAYNIIICMILGILHIVQNIWLLSIINFIIGSLFLYKIVKKHECQKYKCSKFDIVSIMIISILFCIMFVKDLYIFNGDVTHYAVDSAIHYRAAKHYSENLQLFVFSEDKTFFDFNIMQTGAYINDGIFMNVINNITGLEKIYIYQLFETWIMFVGGLAFYSSFSDKIKTKRGLIGSLMLFGLYMYGYPYNSWIYGFSYLSVGIAMTALLLPLVEMLFSEENVKKSIVIPLIVITAMGLIFSYCLFVPVIFASICIYVFLEELKDKNSKKYLKLFGKNTLLITGLLLVVTAFGIGYLFIPSFIIEGQKDLVSALQENGGIYNEKYKNFIFYIPFAIVFIIELIKRIREKEIRYLDIFSVSVIGYLVLFYVGMFFGRVSPYYMLKLYFIVWIVIFAVTIDILNRNIDNKIFRLNTIVFIMLFAFLVIKRFSSESIFGIYLVILLVLAPQTINSIDFSKIKFLPEKLRKNVEIKSIAVTPFVYVVIISLFISGWTWIKSGHVISEEEKHALPNLVRMYYSENCEYRKAIDLIQNFNSNNILITNYARENLEDMTADNTILITERPYQTMWAIATLEYSSENLTFRNIIKATNHNDVQSALDNEDIKYIIRLDTNEQNKLEECKNSIEEVKKAENAEMLYSNKNGFVAQINR